MSQELEIPRPNRIYPSRRDRWITVGLLSIQVILFVLGMRLFFGPAHEQWIGLLPLGIACYLEWVLLGTYYIIDCQHLRVRCAAFRWDIPLENIKSLSSSRSSEWGPALALNRFLIEYQQDLRDRVLLISPEQPEEFLAELKYAAPGVVLKFESD